MSADARGWVAAQSGADVQHYLVVTFDVGGAARAVVPADEVDVVCVVAAVVNVVLAAADVVVVLEAVADALWAADDD